MSDDLPLRCRCGAVRGVATEPTKLNRVVCYCDDCQAFARFLGRDDLLDALGGSDICQMALSRLRITEGREHLRSMRLSDKGLRRWYTDCCRTPVGNTLDNPRVPFVGVSAALFEAQGSALDAQVGPPRMFVMGRFARGGCPPHVHPKIAPADMARVGLLMLRWVLGRRHRPSPFLDPATQRPIAEPKVLTPAERAAL